MKKLKRVFKRAVGFGFGLTALSILCVFIIPCQSAVLYKSYVVKYDRGWDILCDPYIVQKDDWVYKIFRQKGEISAKDFREFLSIFKRLNPHIHDIDRIRPNQNILIPLKKIEPNTFPDQSSGLVTIPFVTISKVSDLLESYSNQYKVKKGDYVSKLIAGNFGTYGSKNYQEGIQLFKALNPEVVDLDLIFIGQELRIPDPVLRNQAWYQSLFDSYGKIKNELKGGSERYSASRYASTKETLKSSGDPISETAAILDGKLLNRGTYFFPQKGKEDFELDLSRHPVIELKDGSRIIFSKKNTAASDLNVLRSLWKNVSVVEIGKDTPVEDILGSVFQDIKKDITGNEISFSENGMDVIVKAKWIKTKKLKGENTIRHICISLIDDITQKTSDAIVRYLDQHDIVIKDVLVREAGADTNNNIHKSSPFVRPDVVTITPIDHKLFVKELVEAMGNNYSKNITVTFPYAGIQVQAVSDLVSTSNGKEFLINYGELYGDAVKEIQKTGLEIIQLDGDDTMNTIIVRVLEAIGDPFVSDPFFLGAERSGDFNTELKIKGYFVKDSNESKILIATIPLHNRILQFLNESGIRVILAGLLDS